MRLMVRSSLIFLALLLSATRAETTDSVLQKRIAPPFGSWTDLSPHQQHQIRYWAAQFAGVKPPGALPKGCLKRFCKKALIASGLAKPFPGVRISELTDEQRNKAYALHAELHTYFNGEGRGLTGPVPDHVLERAVHRYYQRWHEGPSTLSSVESSPAQSPRAEPLRPAHAPALSRSDSDKGISVHAPGESPPHQRQYLHGPR